MASPCDNCPGLGGVSPGSGHHRGCNGPAILLGRNLDLIDQIMLVALPARFGVHQHPHGVRNGWAQWPLQFDTIWIDSCKLRAAVEARVTKAQQDQAPLPH